MYVVAKPSSLSSAFVNEVASALDAIKNKRNVSSVSSNNAVLPKQNLSVLHAPVPFAFQPTIPKLEMRMLEAPIPYSFPPDMSLNKMVQDPSRKQVTHIAPVRTSSALLLNAQNNFKTIDSEYDFVTRYLLDGNLIKFSFIKKGPKGIGTHLSNY